MEPIFVDSYRALWFVGMASTAYGAFLLVQVRRAFLSLDLAGGMCADCWNVYSHGGCMYGLSRLVGQEINTDGDGGVIEYCNRWLLCLDLVLDAL